MTRDEFNLQRLKDDAATNRRVYPILVFCLVGFVILSILAFLTGRTPAGIGSTLVMSTIALRIPLMKQQLAVFDDAIREYEAHIEDPTIPLSERTKAAVATSNFPAVELLKGWIALAITALVLIGAGIFLGVVSEGEDTLLIVCGVGCVIGGIIVFFPAMRMYRSWKVSKALEEAGL
ncbi:MAG: hypothetical protein Q4B54_08035 [Coriobacteriales bacterium]|nr:hypothetical protein [Coriobacteriales bacterium]